MKTVILTGRDDEELMPVTKQECVEGLAARLEHRVLLNVPGGWEHPFDHTRHELGNETGKYSTNVIVSRCVLSVPYRGCTLRVDRLGVYADPARGLYVLYNDGGDLMSGVSQSNGANTRSALLRAGDEFTFPTGCEPGSGKGDAVYFRLAFFDGGHGTENVTVNSMSAAWSSGEIQISYVADAEDVVARNRDKESAVASAMYNVYTPTFSTAQAALQDDKYRCPGNLATFVHGSDLHGDAVRLENLMSYADYIKADAVLLSGDQVAMTCADGGEYVAEVAGRHKTDTLVCIGNHDGYSESKYPQAEAVSSVLAKNKSLTAVDNSAADSNYGKTYYYTDLSKKKMRVIAMNQWKGENYFGIGAKQISWFIDTLKSTPAGYGVIVLIHSQECIPMSIDGHTQFYSTYEKEIARSAEVTTRNEMEVLYSIVDCFKNGTDGSGSFEDSDNSGTTTSYSYEFSNKKDGVEFVAWVTGHYHHDMIGTVPNHSDQLVLNIGCSNGTTRYETDFGRDGHGKSQDLFNVYGIDRWHKTVNVVRIGADVDMRMAERKYMSIPYA